MSEKFRGKVKGVDITEGKKQNGQTWKRASIKVEGENNTITVSTFDEGDINIANQNNGSDVEVTFTKKDDKYNNLIKGGIKPLNQKLNPQEEMVGETASGVPTGASHSASEPKAVLSDGGPVQQPPSKPKEPIVDTQRLIVRQNSWSQALKYIETCMKDDEKKAQSLEYVKKIAHDIEEDIMRSG
ncbi:MAG: hypothetical protein GY861_17175 [bacterium]|nr:hypothetical protein [bacterium]